MTIKRHNPIALLPIQKIIFFALICFMPLSAANFTVEMYGGTGNGTTDDSQAFISCIAAMKSNGQDNVLTLGSQKIYRLGKQTVIGTSKVPRITGEALFKGFTKNIKIVGNYSTLRLNAGLKWGSFDPATGAGYYPPNFPQVQFVDQAYKCKLPSVLKFESCAGVEISELYVDGSLSLVIPGGYFGDHDRQVEGYGIELFNVNSTAMRNVWVYNCALDGVINTQTGPKMYDDFGVQYPDRAWGYYPVNYFNVHAHYNSRNGFTWAGGNGYTMDSCSATNNGRSVYGSSPMAGFDSESHYSDKGFDAPNFQGYFKNCVFTNNIGAGYVAWDNSDTSWIVFDNCEFQSDRYYGLCVKKNQHSFLNSRFYGSQYCVANSGATDWHRNYFQNCTFTDENNPRFPIMYDGASLIYGGGENMEFWQCIFKASKRMAFALQFTTPEKRMKLNYITLQFSGASAASGYTVAGYLSNSNISNLTISSSAGYTADGYISSSNQIIGENVSVLPGSKVSWNFNYGAVTPGTYP